MTNELLINANIELLESAREVIEHLDAATYAESSRKSGQRFGAQLRHVLEFYESFLNGLPTSHIDYDARVRDKSVEQDREAGLARIDEVIQGLRCEPLLSTEFIIWVRMEDAPEEAGDAYMTSSITRELQVLRSHTTHHFALMAMLLIDWGITVNCNFGVAPSTLRYRQSIAA